MNDRSQRDVYIIFTIGIFLGLSIGIWVSLIYTQLFLPSDASEFESESEFESINNTSVDVGCIKTGIDLGEDVIVYTCDNRGR